MRACRRRPNIPCRGGQYVLTVVSRHYVACEHLTVRQREVTLRLAYHIYAQAQCVNHGQSQQLVDPQRHISKGSDHMSCIVTPMPPAPHAPCMMPWCLVMIQTCERLLTLREPGLRRTRGLDAENPPAADAHEGTEEHITDAHRDRHTVDYGISGMSADFDMLQCLAGDVLQSRI